MYPELTNLLPPERLRSMRRDYFLRLATVGVSALALVILASGALLLPSYIYLSQQIAVQQNRATDLDGRLSAMAGQEANKRIATLASDADYLARLKQTPAASAAFRVVLAVSRPGITLTGFTYTPPAKGSAGQMTLIGSAQTRETLRSYVSELGSLSFVSNADLPISSYAKDSDIPFTITLTGSLTP